MADVVPAGILLAPDDVLVFVARSGPTVVGPGTIFIKGWNLDTNTPWIQSTGSDATATNDWSVEEIGRITVSVNMSLQSIGGGAFKGTADGLRNWFGVEAFKTGDTNNAYWSFGRFCGTGISWFWEPGANAVSPLYSPATPGKLFTFQAEVTNGAGGAGTQSLTITAATGGRIEVLGGQMQNLDTAARPMTITLQDAPAGNTIRRFGRDASVAVSGVFFFPVNPTVGEGTFDTGRRMLVAGANSLFMETVGVAASENSTYAVSLLVWGAAPTFTLAGASTPTLTTNTSRFEAG